MNRCQLRPHRIGVETRLQPCDDAQQLGEGRGRLRDDERSKYVDISWLKPRAHRDGKLKAEPTRHHANDRHLTTIESDRLSHDLRIVRKGCGEQLLRQNRDIPLPWIW